MQDNETWQLGAVYKNLARVRMSRSEVKGRGHQGQKKNEKKTAESFPLAMHSHECVVGRKQQVATDVRGDGLRRLENQRMLSSYYH